MSIVLFDNAQRSLLFPFTHTRAVGTLRMGIFTQQERWALALESQVSIHTTPLLQSLYDTPATDEYLWVDAAVIPNAALLTAIHQLKPNTALTDSYGWIAGRVHMPFGQFNASKALSHCTTTIFFPDTQRIIYPWQMIQWNDQMIREDFELLTQRRSSPLPPPDNAIYPEQIFIEEGAVITHALLNASTGPIYIGKDAQVMEGTAIRGPFVLGNNSVVKMNSRLYGATTIGPSCLAGGEIKNSIMMGYSNKAHDGYLGDSYIGEWCNMGAGTTNSNIKNNAGVVLVWQEATQTHEPVGEKMGMLMGDYTRTAIQSAINTGSVIGLAANVFGAGLLPKEIPHFSWGVAGETYVFEKAIRDIENWKKLKQQTLGKIEINILQEIYNQISKNK